LPDPEALSGKVPVIPLEDLAQKYAEAILRHHPEGPYILMGECIGGMDAFAIGCALQKVTDAEVRLMLLDTTAPEKISEPEKDHHQKYVQSQIPQPPAFDSIRETLKRWLTKGSEAGKMPATNTAAFRKMKELALSWHLFDERFYLDTNDDVAVSGYDPFLHYMNSGWREGRPPSIFFNARTYAQINSTYVEEEENPIAHFLNKGRYDNHVLHCVRKLDPEGTTIKDILMKYGLFDEAWYLARNPDLGTLHKTPLLHYMIWGYREKRDPAPFFTAELYKLSCPQFKMYEQNPILHFILTGVDDPKVEKNVRYMHVSEEQRKRILALGLFDEAWYRKAYPSVPYYGKEPFRYHQTIGWRLNRKPFESFDEEAYAAANPDFIPGQTNPVIHMLEHVEAREIVNEEKAGPSIKQTDNEGIKAQNMEKDDQDEVVLSARVKLRKDVYNPGKFKGDLYIMASFPASIINPTLGWERYVDGRVIPVHAVGDHHSYVWEDWRENVELIGKYINLKGG
jgi:hypothetical protein